MTLKEEAFWIKLHNNDYHVSQGRVLKNVSEKRGNRFLYPNNMLFTEKMYLTA